MKSLVKKLILTALILTPLFAFGQTFEVEWDPKISKIEAFKVDASGSRDRIDPKDIPQKTPFTLNVSDNIKTLIFKEDGEANLDKEFVSNDWNGHVDDNKIVLRIDGANKVSLGTKSIQLKYPYIITSILDGGKDTITIGSSRQTETDGEDREPILQGVSWEFEDRSSIDELVSSIQVEKKNAVLLIDCSNLPQSESILLRAKKKNKDSIEVKKVNVLHTGDYVKVYFYNLNRYLYTISLNDVQEDYRYGNPQITLSRSTSDGKVTESASTGTDNSPLPPEEQLEKYAAATDSLSSFIQFVKTQANPSSVLLDENKRKIEDNLKTANISPKTDIGAIYAQLEDESKEIEKDYKKAQKFKSVYAEFRSLSYTIESTLLPIKVQSYDQIQFNVTLKDPKGNTVGTQREYIYKIVGGIKVDQSFGIIGHGLTDQFFTLKSVSIKDTVFGKNPNGEIIPDSIVQINDGSKKEILENPSSSKLSLGLSTLTHFYWRLGTVNFGPHIGFAIDVFPQQSIRYLAGGSLMFTDGRHRVSLDCGVTLGNVKVLSPTTSVGQLIDNSSTEAPRIDVGRTSIYFGISYNIPINPTNTQSAKAKN